MVTKLVVNEDQRGALVPNAAGTNSPTSNSTLVPIRMRIAKKALVLGIFILRYAMNAGAEIMK